MLQNWYILGTGEVSDWRNRPCFQHITHQLAARDPELHGRPRVTPPGRGTGAGRFLRRAGTEPGIARPGWGPPAPPRRSPVGAEERLVDQHGEERARPVEERREHPGKCRGSGGGIRLLLRGLPGAHGGDEGRRAGPHPGLAPGWPWGRRSSSSSPPVPRRRRRPGLERRRVSPRLPGALPPPGPGRPARAPRGARRRRGGHRAGPPAGRGRGSPAPRAPGRDIKPGRRQSGASRAGPRKGEGRTPRGHCCSQPSVPPELGLGFARRDGFSQVPETENQFALGGLTCVKFQGTGKINTLNLLCNKPGCQKRGRG